MTMKKFVYLGLLALLPLFGCYKVQEVLIQSDLMPIDGFSQIDMNAIAVLNFDASGIHRRNVDNIALRDAVAYDITKALYQLNKIRVIQGEAVQNVTEKGEQTQINELFHGHCPKSYFTTKRRTFHFFLAVPITCY